MQPEITHVWPLKKKGKRHPHSWGYHFKVQTLQIHNTPGDGGPDAPRNVIYLLIRKENTSGDGGEKDLAAECLSWHKRRNCVRQISRPKQLHNTSPGRRIYGNISLLTQYPEMYPAKITKPQDTVLIYLKENLGQI